MKDVVLFAIDRKWRSRSYARTTGLEGTIIESKGDFELVIQSAIQASYAPIEEVVSVVFDSLDGLLQELDSFPGFSNSHQGRLEAGGIRLMVMICHGAPGVLFVNGVDKGGNSGDYLDSKTMDTKYSSDLQKLGTYLRADATVRFDSCNAGSGYYGDILLTKLSKLWPGIRVVGYTDYGLVDPNEHVTMLATTPETTLRVRGVYDTGLHDREPDRFDELSKRDLGLLAMRSEHSPNAKIAQNGQLVKRPAQEVLLNSQLVCPADQVIVPDDETHGHCGASTAPGRGAAAPHGAHGGVLRNFDEIR